MQALYAYFQSTGASVDKAEKELFFSINKSYDLFHYLLLLITDVAIYAESRIDLARQKRIPTKEDLNPNTRFIDNKLIEQIRENKDLERYLNAKRMSWVNYPELIKSVFNSVKESEHYQRYMVKEQISYKDEKELIIKIFEQNIAESELLYQILEEQSIYWNDEVEFIISMIMRVLSKFKKTDAGEKKLPEIYKSDEDKDFVKVLFRKCIQRESETKDMIMQYTKNWDVERIAFMDILLMQIALTEATEFTSIPTKVTFNEYIEIAKYYSTERSNVFINGILDRIINDLRNDNKIVKRGRGLIGEV